jgi:hypothetical protein
VWLSVASGVDGAESCVSPFGMRHRVTRFKSLGAALNELERFIRRSGNHLQTGKPFKQFGGMRSREMLANWLLCVVGNYMRQADQLTFSSDPIGGDGVITNTVMDETWPTEHVLVPSIPAGNPPMLKC